jgi:hypothetical protein
VIGQFGLRSSWPGLGGGYRNVLLGVDKTPADSDKPATTASQEDKDTYTKAQGLNELAYEDLVLCIDGSTC